MTGMAMHESLKKLMSSQIANAVEVRDTAEYTRAMQGLAPLEVHICLGPGRCMFPRQGQDERLCAFCQKYPNGHNADSDIAAETHKILAGN